MFYMENKLAPAVKFQMASKHGKSWLTSLKNLSPVARWQSLSENHVLLWNRLANWHAVFFRHIPADWKKSEICNTICHLTVQKFPLILRVFWSYVDFHLWEGGLVMRVFMGSKIYLWINSDYIISCNLGFPIHGRHVMSQLGRCSSFLCHWYRSPGIQGPKC